MKPVLIEDKSAIVLRDGWPVVTNDAGEELVWDIDKQRDAMAASNREAAERRDCLEAIATHYGLGVDVRKPAGREALLEVAARQKPEFEELAALRGLKEAGSLDDSAQEKIEAAAANLSKQQIDAKEVEIEALRRGKVDSDATAATADKRWKGSQMRQGLVDFWNRSRAKKDGKGPRFQPDSLEGFITAMGLTDNGARWAPTGKTDKHGSPELVRLDGNDAQVKGPEGYDNLSLTRYTLDTLPKAWGILFEKQENATGVERFGRAGAKGWGDQTPAEIESAARQMADSAAQ